MRTVWLHENEAPQYPFGAFIQHGCKGCLLLRLYVGSLQSLRTFFYVKAYRLAFRKRTLPIRQAAGVHEYIVSTFIRRYETIPLGFVEPLHGTCGHFIYPFTV